MSVNLPSPAPVGAPGDLVNPCGAHVPPQVLALGRWEVVSDAPPLPPPSGPITGRYAENNHPIREFYRKEGQQIMTARRT